MQTLPSVMHPKALCKSLHLLAGSAVLLLAQSPVAPVRAVETTQIAPNLMIIFGNAYSMNRAMDDQTYPSLDTDGSGSMVNDVFRFDDDGHVDNPVTGDHGTYAALSLYANQPDSKLYQAKQAFSTILADDNISADINFGFATFRQTFGLRLSTEKVVWNTSWPQLFPDGGKPADGAIQRTNPLSPANAHPRHPDGNAIYTASTQAKTDFANDPNNFSYLNWSPVWLPWGNSAGYSPECEYLYTGSSRLGKPGSGTFYESGRSIINDSTATYLSQVDGFGGLPLSFAHDDDAIDQTYQPSTCNPGNAYWPWAKFNATRSRSTDEAAAGIPPVTHTLCRTYYKSQQNIFEALYTSDRVFQNEYPNKWNGYHVHFQTPGSYLYYEDGLVYNRSGQNRSDVTYTTQCDFEPTTRTIMKQTVEASHQFLPSGPYADKSDSSEAYFSLNSSFVEGTWSEVSNSDYGALTGWSGETTYTLNTSDGSESMTASYPSGTADPCRNDRDLCPSTTLEDDPDLLHRYVKTMGADKPDAPRHMGVFLDLPDPNSGYSDNRDTLKSFMGYTQMDDSGLDYNPDTQVIANGKGVSTASLSWYAYQSPLYQSLFSALAYFSAYKEEDPYDHCGRSNNILLFYDGKEDGRWSEDADGNKVYAKPEDMAARLNNELGVNVYVIILSNNEGDIEQANLIAASGGTDSAIAVDSLDALEGALTDVFAVLKTKASYAPAYVAPKAVSGDYVFEVQDRFHPDFGQLVAYKLDSEANVVGGDSLSVSGNDAASAIWQADDGSNQTAELRKERLYSTNGSGAIVNFYEDLEDAAFVETSTVSADSIREFTLDPGYDDGAYLAGRKSGTLLGLIGESSPLLMAPPADVSLYEDADYRTFALSESNRDPQVIVSSQDGFLYALDAASGELNWGWMPRQFVADLKNYQAFQDRDHFSGSFDLIDAKNSTGNYHSYVVGSAESGKLHYALRLTSIDNIPQLSSDSLIWSDYNSSYGAPGNSAIQFWRGDAGVTYALYINGPDSGNAVAATLTIRDISSSGTAPIQYALQDSNGNWPVYGTPLVVEEADGSTYIYIGTQDGNLHRLSWSGYGAGGGGLLSLSDNFASGSELGDNAAIDHIGYTRYRGTEYLRLQSDNRLTILKRATSTDDWAKSWSSYAGGADNYSLVPTSTATIQHLPDSSEISAEALIVLGSVVLPVYSSSTADNTCSSGNGYYYVFALDTGLFPNTVFLSDDGLLVDSDFGEDDQDGQNNPVIAIGDGRPHSPQFSLFEGNMTLFSHTEDSYFSAVTLQQTLTGMRSWRELY